MAAKPDSDYLTQDHNVAKSSVSPLLGSPTSGTSRDNANSLFDTEAKGQEHSFLMDRGDVEQMENGLMELLSNFKEGKLHAFGAKFCGITSCIQIDSSFNFYVI